MPPWQPFCIPSLFRAKGVLDRHLITGERREEVIIKRKGIVWTLLFVLLTAVAPAGAAWGGGVPGRFDFYVLALSWSPAFCDEARNRDHPQCRAASPSAFVLHGLWPQYERGYPRDCSAIPFPEGLKAEFPKLFPHDALYAHEWRRHGTCSGLSPRGYLALAKRIREGVIIPPAYEGPDKPLRLTVERLRSDFIRSDGRLSPRGIVPVCSHGGRFLKEVWLCFEKDGRPRDCSEEILKRGRKTCRQETFLLKPPRP